jgi:hypothetical protein
MPVAQCRAALAGDHQGAVPAPDAQGSNAGTSGFGRPQDIPFCAASRPHPVPLPGALPAPQRTRPGAGRRRWPRSAIGYRPLAWPQHADAVTSAPPNNGRDAPIQKIPASMTPGRGASCHGRTRAGRPTATSASGRAERLISPATTIGPLGPQWVDHRRPFGRTFSCPGGRPAVRTFGGGQRNACQ